MITIVVADFWPAQLEAVNGCSVNTLFLSCEGNLQFHEGWATRWQDTEITNITPHMCHSFIY